MIKINRLFIFSGTTIGRLSVIQSPKLHYFYQDFPNSMKKMNGKGVSSIEVIDIKQVSEIRSRRSLIIKLQKKINTIKLNYSRKKRSNEFFSLK